MGLAPHTRTRLAAVLVAAPLLAASSGLLLASPADAQATGAVKAVTATSKFDPATITISAGGTVTWTGDGFHTVTGGDGTADPSSPIGDHQLTDASSKVEVKFDKPGTYKYFCQPHVSLGMKGEVVVTAAGGAPAPAPSTAASASASATAAPTPTVDPGGASESAGPGEQNVDGEKEGEEIPGATAKDNKTLKDIEHARNADASKLSGFNTLLAAGTLALLVLGVAIFASTRPRRPSK